MNAATSRRPVLSEVAAGDVVGRRTVHVDRARLVEYAAASGDRNRIHWDERFARSVGLPDVIAHGMFTMGAAGEVASHWAGGPQHVRSWSCRFTHPVVVSDDGGADIEVVATVTRVDAEAGEVTLGIEVTHDDVKVLGRAVAVVAVEGSDSAEAGR
ncbi:MaoC/PaaZ C-terminal domain-containing protein [Mobilicoccus pelagius]|uniref:Putative fatty acid synthase n=1 Tax=Mobilicoccus pelagius NBRC 104925 TaxID=1089455 RepID=H5UQ91_9MICO|nr:MaoC/PaaZ C-terminal domain-containing protein [Mobilicoccus pelagius]GAB47899.1 putative fatty acid synthase [Mobilicoccus pelagius NBRC 104925]